MNCDFDGFETEVGDVYRILKYRDDQFEDSLESYLTTHEGMVLSPNGAELLRACGVAADIKDPDNIDEKGRVFMCKSMVSLINKRLREQTVNYIINAVDELGWTEPQAMDFYRVPEEERPRYEALVEAERTKRANAAAAPAAS